MKRVISALATLALAMVGQAARAQTTPTAPASPAEAQQAAPAQAAPPSQGVAPVQAEAAKPAAKPAAPAVTNKWNASLYGFIELDTIHDSTQSFNDLAGNGAVARPKAYGGTGSHERVIFSPRNSRFGLKVGAPEYEGMKASAVLESDFFGNQPSDASEAAVVNNPTFRIRHAYLKLETPVVDLVAGQTWELFGWQAYFHPNTVDLQGVPGQVYSRTQQVRLSKVLKTDDLTLELAAAALRPPQRDASLPDGQAGVKLLVNRWKAVHTGGGTGTSIDPAGIGVSGLVRRFEVQKFTPAGGAGTTTANANGWGYSVDALVPLIPAPDHGRENALTFTGSFAKGAGIADLYTGLSGGSTTVGGAGLPSGATYKANVDNGLVAFAPDGSLHAIDWRSFIVGLQYYLPPAGNVWVSANFAGMYSDNISRYATDQTKVYHRSYWADGNLFWDITPAVRMGAEFAWFQQTYADGAKATNRREQLSFYYLF